MRYSKNTRPHHSELPPPYTESQMLSMKAKGKRVRKIAKEYLKRATTEIYLEINTI